MICTAFGRAALPTIGPGSITVAGGARRRMRRRRCAIRRRAYPFLPVEGESLHQIPVGPVHAGIIEPGHFRFTASGETVVRLEQRLGYVHKGIESLMVGATLDKAARLAGRVSGDSTVAYAIAFARAVEAATGSAAPARADWLRALMAELERVANHLGDIGAICNDAAFALMHAHCGVLRERVLRDGRFLLRPSADDGPGEARRRRGRSRARRKREHPTTRRGNPASVGGVGDHLRQHRLAAGPHGGHRHPSPGIRGAVRLRRFCRPRLGPRRRCAPVRPATRLTTNSRSIFRSATRVTSMRGSGSGSARSSKVWR